MVNLKIDGKIVSVPKNTTILDAAKTVGVKIPTLCYMKEINEIAACRVCVVEVEGYNRLLTSCNNTVHEGMIIHTNSKKVRDARKINVELILSEHNTNCAICARSGNCALQKVANDLNILRLPYKLTLVEKKSNIKFPLIREYDKCIGCMRCVQVCEKIQASNIWDVVNTGARTMVDVKNFYNLESSDCTLCGQCITHCPVGALRERDDSDRVLEAIGDKNKICIAQIAPSIRTAYGEAFDIDPEFATMERLCGALKIVGFDYVFDTDFSADLTIMEEASEFLKKINSESEDEKFPMFTSCCPGWVRYVKAKFPEFVDNLSSAKSPQQMFGAIAKSYYAHILGEDPSKICVVSIMPCLAKKAECELPNNRMENGEKEVDVVLTTRELNRLLRSSHIDLRNVEEVKLDMPLGFGSGAGNIFGASGGVMEAALRTAYYMATNRNPSADSFRSVRGMEGWKESEFEINGRRLKLAIVNGLENAHKMLTMLKQKRVEYDFVEVMACPGGCVGGGGQPIHEGEEWAANRAPVLYKQDKENEIRFSHENPSIIACYKNFLHEPLSEISEKLLHTNHHSWKMPNEK